MDIAGTQAVAAAQAPVAPWIAVGVLVALGALLLAGLVAALVRGRPVRRTEEASATPPEPVDDLAAFLESPPGTATPRSSAGGEFVALAAPPVPIPAQRPDGRALAAVAGGGVLLLAAAAVVATVASGPDRPADRSDNGGRGGPEPGQAAEAPDDEARLTFGGIVLEERAVGVTVTYPELVLDGDAASLVLPTWNCMGAEAPEEPAAPGCAPGRTEYADLHAPDLEVVRVGDGLRITGEFATATHPTGSGPEATGRAYRIVVTVAPDDPVRPGRWTPASADLELGDRRVAAVEGELRLAD